MTLDMWQESRMHNALKWPEWELTFYNKIKYKLAQLITQETQLLKTGILNHTFLSNLQDVIPVSTSAQCMFEFQLLYSQSHKCEEYWKYNQEEAIKDSLEQLNNAAKMVYLYNFLTHNKHHFYINRISPKSILNKYVRRLICQNIEEEKFLSQKVCKCYIIHKMVIVSMMLQNIWNCLLLLMFIN